MKFLSFIFFVLAVFSCSPVYLPNSRNVPMFSKGGEVQGNVSFVSGYNFQAAASVTNHIGIMANGLYSDSKTSSHINSYSFVEGGIGYFNNSKDGKYYFEIFGGFGSGKSKSTDSVFSIHPVFPSGFDIHLSSANYNRYFFQPSIGLKRKYFHGAIAYRFSLMDFKNGTNNGKSIELSRTPVMLFEPAIVLKFPFDNVVLHVQAGLTTPIDRSDLYFDYVPVVVSTGIGFRVGYSSPDKK